MPSAGTALRREAEQVAAFLDWMKQRNYSPRTVRNARYELNRFLSFLAATGIERVQDVTLEHLEAYRLALRDGGMTPGAITGYMSAVRNWFRFLEARQQLFVNPAEKLLVQRPPPMLPRVPPERDVRRFLCLPDVTRPLGVRDRAIFEVAYSCGPRLEELSALSVFDADLSAGTLRVLGKGRKERVLPLGKQAVRWLERYRCEVRPGLVHDPLDEPALWLNSKGGKLVAPGMVAVFQRYSRQAGFHPPVTVHTLRRACVTHMLQHGAHPVKLQMLLGHATLKNLSQYLSLTITDLRAAHRRSKPGR